MRVLAALVGCVVVVGAAGCGGGAKATGGSIPVKTVEQPGRTVTYPMGSASMEPTIHCPKPNVGCTYTASDRVVVQEPATVVRRGDVVLFRAPPRTASACGRGGLFIRRVIGLPGETVREHDGFVYINGKLLKESYVPGDRRAYGLSGSWHVRAGEYFVLGDNREQSCDSWNWGGLPEADIVGKIVQILRSR